MSKVTEHLWKALKEHVIHWVLGGALLVSTGLAPEEWIAQGAHRLGLSEDILHLWAANLDIRVVPISMGMVVIVISLLRRYQASQPVPTHGSQQLHSSPSAETGASTDGNVSGLSESRVALSDRPPGNVPTRPTRPDLPGKSRRHAPTYSGILSIKDINFVIENGWTGVDLLNRLIALDYEIIENLDMANEGSAEQWAPIFMEYPDTWRLIVDNNNQIVGYWHFAPLDRESFRDARRGQLLDSNIARNHLRYFGVPGVYDVYFTSIGIHPSHRNAKGNWLLLSSLLDVVNALVQHDIWIGTICSLAYSQSGKMLCKDLQMKLTHVLARGEIYESSMVQLLSRLRMDRYLCYGDYREIGELYQMKFRVGRS